VSGASLRRGREGIAKPARIAPPREHPGGRTSTRLVRAPNGARSATGSNGPVQADLGRPLPANSGLSINDQAERTTSTQAPQILGSIALRDRNSAKRRWS